MSDFLSSYLLGNVHITSSPKTDPPTPNAEMHPSANALSPAPKIIQNDEEALSPIASQMEAQSDVSQRESSPDPYMYDLKGSNRFHLTGVPISLCNKHRFRTMLRDITVNIKHIYINHDYHQKKGIVCIHFEDSNSAHCALLLIMRIYNAHANTIKMNPFCCCNFEQLQIKQRLLNVKIKRKDTCFVVGLPISICDRLVLSSTAYFGAFGKVKNVFIKYAEADKVRDSGRVHITYDNEEGVDKAIVFINAYKCSSRRLKACYSMTGYCRGWFEHGRCLYPKCFYVHQMADAQDIISMQEIDKFNKIPAGPWPGAQKCEFVSFADYAESKEDTKFAIDDADKLKLENSKLRQKVVDWEMKYDELNVKYIALQEELENICGNKNVDWMNKKYDEWSGDDVVNWMMSLNDGAFAKFEMDLRNCFKEENVNGTLLSEIEKCDLKDWGIKDFALRSCLFKRIQALIHDQTK